MGMGREAYPRRDGNHAGASNIRQLREATDVVMDELGALERVATVPVGLSNGERAVA